MEEVLSMESVDMKKRARHKKSRLPNQQA